MTLSSQGCEEITVTSTAPVQLVDVAGLSLADDVRFEMWINPDGMSGDNIYVGHTSAVAAATGFVFSRGLHRFRPGGDIWAVATNDDVKVLVWAGTTFARD